MSKGKLLIVTAASLQGLLDNSSETTDFKKLFEEMIPGVQVIETNAATLAEQLATVQKELDAANGRIVILDGKVATIPGMQEQFENEIASANGIIANLKQQLEEQDSLQELLEKTQEANVILQRDLDDALAQVGELGKMLDLQQSVRDGSIIVHVDGVAKKLLGDRFHLKGEKQMNAQEISKRPDLLEKMVAIRSDAIVDLDSPAGQQVNVTNLDLE